MMKMLSQGRCTDRSQQRQQHAAAWRAIARQPARRVVTGIRAR
jgi:hypothetical protein